MGQWLRGYENFYCDLAGDRPLAEALCDKIIELKMSYWDKALPILGDLVDVVQEGDDYGSQRRLQVSPDTWRDLFKPRLRELISHIKAHRRSRPWGWLRLCGSAQYPVRRATGKYPRHAGDYN